MPLHLLKLAVGIDDADQIGTIACRLLDRGLRDRLGILAPLYTRSLRTGQAESGDGVDACSPHGGGSPGICLDNHVFPNHILPTNAGSDRARESMR